MNTRHFLKPGEKAPAQPPVMPRIFIPTGRPP
jgi:hypothetical protein